MEYNMRTCDACEVRKGFMSFHYESTTCKLCLQWEKEKQWIAEGKVFLRHCGRCGDPKNLFTAYGVAKNKLRQGTCRDCKNKDAREKVRMKPVRKCFRSFIMDGNKICKDCDTIKAQEDFDKDRITCRECLGLPSKKREYRTKEHNICTYDENSNEDRELRLKRKGQRQDKFTDRFNKQFGVLA